MELLKHYFHIISKLPSRFILKKVYLVRATFEMVSEKAAGVIFKADPVILASFG